MEVKIYYLLIWLMMECRVVNSMEDFDRQDAKFAERKEESFREKWKGNPRFSVDSLRTWRLGGQIRRFIVSRGSPP
jgi:hypothetical protein